MTHISHEVESFWRHVFQTYYVRVQEPDMSYPDVKSVVFTWAEFSSISMNLADWICDNAMECKLVGERLFRETFFTERQFQSIDGPVCIRIIEPPKDKRMSISKLKHHFNRKMILVSGMVRKLSKSDAYMLAAFFQNTLCNHTWVEKQNPIYLKRPNIYPSCGRGAFKAIVNYRVPSNFRDYQDRWLQESSEGLIGGKQPWSVRFCLKGDLKSKLAVGAKVKLNGTLRMEDKKESDDGKIK